MSATAVERTHLLDALRGFALCGVAFINFAKHSCLIFMPPEEQAAKIDKSLYTDC